MNKKKILNALPYLAVFLILIYTQGSSILNNFTIEGSEVPSKEVTQFTINSERTNLTFPPKGKSITVFWHSQCAPCKLEMKRLKNSVENQRIDSTKLFAINPFESDLEIKKFIKKNQLPFRFIKDNEISKILNVKVTPTTVFIKDNKVSSMSTGLSTIGIWLAELFI